MRMLRPPERTILLYYLLKSQICRRMCKFCGEIETLTFYGKATKISVFLLLLLENRTERETKATKKETTKKRTRKTRLCVTQESKKESKKEKNTMTHTPSMRDTTTLARPRKRIGNSTQDDHKDAPKKTNREKKNNTGKTRIETKKTRNLRSKRQPARTKDRKTTSEKATEEVRNP